MLGNYRFQECCWHIKATSIVYFGQEQELWAQGYALDSLVKCVALTVVHWTSGTPFSSTVGKSSFAGVRSINSKRQD
jgi:hypothetical protein